jgi:predicted transcriptional regulator
VLPDNFAKSARSADAGSCFAKATAIFRLGRLRAKHFPNGLLADSTMSLMLSLFIGEQQHIILSERTLALANQLSHEDAARIIENLVHAGLVVITGEEPGRRTVGLTPIGSARTRSFVEDHPDL